jgi:hypothetical protein
MVAIVEADEFEFAAGLPGHGREPVAILHNILFLIV